MKGKIFQIVIFLTGIVQVILSSCKPDQVEPDGFPAVRIFSLYIDPSGIIWAGSDAGLISFDGENWMIHRMKGFSESNIREFAYQLSGPEKGLWMASSEGALSANTVMNEISSIVSYKEEEGKLLDNDLQSVVLDSLGAKWFASRLGLSILKDSQWLSEDEYGDFIRYPVISLGAASNGWIFAGTAGIGVGRYKLNEEINAITGASLYDKEWSGLKSDTILSIHIDDDNSQWFGTTHGVAFHKNWETKIGWENYDTCHGLIHNRVQCIERGNDGNIWFGTPVGITSFDGETWISFSESDGMGNQEVNDIAIDEAGRIWLATNNGISVFDGSQWTVYKRE